MTISELCLRLAIEYALRPEMKVVRLEHVHEQGFSSDYEIDIKEVLIQKSQYSNKEVMVIR